MQVLVLCNDQYHPAQTVRLGLAWLEGAGYRLDWVEDASGWPAESLKAYPLVLLAKSNHTSHTDETPWMTEEIQGAFAAHVQRGNGLLAIHSGTAGYGETPLMRRLLGGVFLQHPPQCPVTVTPLARHPLSAGCEAFTLQDEHYFMELDDRQADVFLTTSSTHGTQPGGWIRAEGEGRVCVLTPGHNLSIWQHPAYQILIANAVRWCAKLA
jgi:type 1 glutamine amidotransferase